MRRYLIYFILLAFISFSTTSCITRPPHRNHITVVEKHKPGKKHKKPKKPKPPKKKTPPPPPEPYRW